MDIFSIMSSFKSFKNLSNPHRQFMWKNPSVSYLQTCTSTTLSISPIMLQQLILHTSVTYPEFFFFFHNSIPGSTEQMEAIRLVSFVGVHKNMDVLWICLSLQTNFGYMYISYQPLQRLREFKRTTQSCSLGRIFEFEILPDSSQTVCKLFVYYRVKITVRSGVRNYIST